MFSYWSKSHVLLLDQSIYNFALKSFNSCFTKSVLKFYWLNICMLVSAHYFVLFHAWNTKYPFVLSMFINIHSFLLRLIFFNCMFCHDYWANTYTHSSYLSLQASLSVTEMALALNRYICSAVLPLLTRCAPLFSGTEHYAALIDSTLHTIYRLSKGRSLTKAQRDTIEECLLSICQ